MNAPIELFNEDDLNSNYAQSSLHMEMIQDRWRTQTYCQAIEKNADQFRGKIVLDVGSGTGILSLFAARAGAARVYSVECTPIGFVSEEIVRDNGFAGVIRIIHKRLEDITDADLPEKVDVIISEWMGYALYFEVMLSSVIQARDRFLRPGGCILPSHARLHLAGAQSYEYYATSLDFWDEVYGFNFSAMKRQALTEPVVDVCERWQVLTSSATVSQIDLHKCSADSSFFTAPFSIAAHQNEVMHAFVAYFSVEFNDMHVRRVLSTSPFKKPTHWKQTFFYLRSPVRLNKNDTIAGTIQFGPNPKDLSGLIITIKYTVNGGQENVLEYDFH